MNSRALPRIGMLALVWVLGALPAWPLPVSSVALAQPMPPFGPDDGFESEIPERTPREDLRISLKAGVRPTDEESTLTGRIDQIIDGNKIYKDDAVAIKRLLFEDDINFETRTYEWGQLKTLLGMPPDTPGTLGPDAEIHVRYQNGDRFRTTTIKYKDIIAIEYPATWLDIFADLMRDAKAIGVEEHLAKVEEFRDFHIAGSGDEMSDAMRTALNAAILGEFFTMRENAPDQVEVYLALGAFLAEQGRFDEELGAYLSAQTRRVPDPEGRLAYRLGEMYLNVLHLPEKALETLEKLPLGSPQGLAASPLRGRAMIETRRYVDAQIFLSEALRTLSDIAAVAQDDPELAALMLPAGVAISELIDEVRTERGDAYLKAGKLYQAGVDLAAIPSTSPQFVRAQLGLAAVYFHSKNFSETNKILRAGRGGLPGIGDAIAGASREADPVADPKVDIFAEGQPEVPYDSAASRALCLLANSMLAQRMQQAVNQAMRSRRQQAKDNQGGELAPLWASDIRPDSETRVAQYALRAMRHDPMSDEPLLVLAEHAARTSGSALAVQWLDRARSVNPTNAMQYYRYGYYMARDGNFVAAISQLRKAVDLKPDFLDAYVMLGEIYYRLMRNFNERMQRDGASEADIRERDELLKHAIAYFKNALGIDPDRIDVKLKLGHCYLERAQIGGERAATLKGQWELRRNDMDTQGKMREQWNAVTGDLANAAEQFDLARFSTPKIIDVLPGTPPRIIINAGEEADVVDGMTFELLRDGPTVTFRVAGKPEMFSSTCVPENYEADLFVQETVARIQPGDRVGNATVADNKRVRRVIYPRQTLMARSAMGFVYYLRDVIAGSKAEVEGRESAPTADLDAARKEWRWVIRYVKDYGDNAFAADPAYLYALRNYLKIRRQARRVQWTDEFDRDRSGTGLDVVGNDWLLNLRRDEGLTIATNEADSRLIISGNQPRGQLTTITRVEDVAVFSGAQVDINVVPTTMIPQGFDGRVGLILTLTPANGGANAPGPAVLVTMDSQGRFFQQIGEWRPGNNADVILGEETALNFRIYGPQVQRKIRTLRIERRLNSDRGNRNTLSYVLVVDDRMEAELAVPDGPFTRSTGNSNDRFRVGIAVLPRANARFDVTIDATRIIRERGASWMQEENRSRDDPTVGDDD